jgi:tRNA-dihydrouridine synthase
MLARGARGNPWIFRRTLEYMGLREPGPPWSLPERVREVYAMILRHTDMQIAGKGSYLGICQMRKHIAWYTTGLPGSSALREAVNRAEDREQLVGVLQDWKERAERMAAG